MKKILLSSDCNGNFQSLFSKVSQLHQKNKFDLMLLVGNVCPISSTQQFSKIIKGQIKVPLPTYFIDSSPMSKIFNLAYPDGDQFADNFTYLGHLGIKSILGLNVAYVSGSNPTQKDINYLNQQHINQKIDILLTNQWPEQIKTMFITHSSNKNQTQTPHSSKLISSLTYNLSPKYHISSSAKVFYRMDPYKNKKSLHTHFINVAEMNKNNLTGKYLLAIQTIPYALNPPEENLQKIVANPFDGQSYKIPSTNANDNKNQANQDGIGNTNFIQNQKEIGFRHKYDLSKYKTKNSQINQSVQSIINEQTYVYFDGVPYQARNYDIQQFLQRWGKVSKLQVFKQQKGNYKSGIAKFSSVQQTKNCLSDSGKYSLYQNRIKFKPKTIQQKYRNQDCWFCEKNQKFDRALLVYKGRYCMVCLDKGPITDIHLQIIPVNHVDTLGKLQGVQMDEINHVKKQLKRYFSQNNFETIICQRYMKLSQQISHCILQFIATKQPKQLVYKLHQLNQDQRLNFNSLKSNDLSSWVRKSQYFIKIQVNQHIFIKQIFPKQKIDFDFMRKLVCQLLGKPQKINWRNCQRRSDKDVDRDRNIVGQLLKQCNLIIQ